MRLRDHEYRQHARLIELKPSADAHSQIECTTIPHGVCDLEYTALSYTAPVDSLQKATITVDGIKHHISDVLHSALHHLRRSDDVLVMWIDPIYLDTGHASQDPLVSLYCRDAIYNNASKVSIWLGEPRETTWVWFSPVDSFSYRGKARSIPRYFLEMEFGNKFMSRTYAYMQPLFRLPWWHWQRVEALLALKDPSKVVFCCGSEHMSWQPFTSVVCFLRYVLPRLESDYSPWLDQILLQIPGKLPEAFREVFHREMAVAETAQARWGEGVLFAHPQDVHYDLKNVAESAAAGRILTRLSARLANRYRRRCMSSFRQRYNTEVASRRDEDHISTLSREDVSLDGWLGFLVAAYHNRSPSSHAVILRALTALETSGPPSDLNMKSSPAEGYSSLNADDHEIRILVLYPNENPRADIVCETFSFNINGFSNMRVERFPYIALSYVCGKGAAANTIWLGSEQREITPNLFEALQSLRDPFVQVPLWVDALYRSRQRSGSQQPGRHDGHHLQRRWRSSGLHKQSAQ